MDVAVVRALASHQCGPVSIPRVSMICGLSLLVLHSLQQEVFLLIWTLVFPSPQKPTFDLTNFLISVYSIPIIISVPALED